MNTVNKDLLCPPINQSEDYFSSYEDIEIHRLMVNDKPRTEAYRDAIMKNKHLFQNKIVMDVGAGTGILSLFAAKAGAKKVYAVEASNIAKCIPAVAKENGYSDIIEVFHNPVEKLSLPSNVKIDIIISEWMGFYLLHESMLSSVIFAREKFLSDEGSIFPSEARMYACPCSLENYYKEQFYYWENVYGFKMNTIKECAFSAKQTKPEVCSISPSDLLAEPVCIKIFNMLYVTESEIERFSSTNFVGITKSGNFHGLAIWFECDFDGRNYDEDGEEYGSLVTLSTSPSVSSTHWKQTVIVLASLKENEHSAEGENEESSPTKMPKIDSDEIEDNLCNKNDELANELECNVDEDEIVGWKLEFRKSEDKERHYSITMETLDPEESEHPIPCVCPMPRCLIIAKMIEKEDEDELLHQNQDDS